MRRSKIEGSSNIAEIGYDLDAMTLEIKFQNGGTYQYWPVTQYGYDSLMNAKSKGHHFNEHFRGDPNVNYKKVDELQASPE